MKKIFVIGGGTAGLISALILKSRFPNINVEIIESSKVGIVGVGESSTEHWKVFCESIGVPMEEFICNTNATFKNGVYFEDWGEEDFIHTVDTTRHKVDADYFRVYAHIICHDRGPKAMCGPENWKNKVCAAHRVPTNQFHFDTYSLNKYLHHICYLKGIGVHVDDLIGVKRRLGGNISSVVSKSSVYEADFFIDCSGFSRFLSKNVRWKSYSKYLPLNSAITFETAEMEEYNLHTHATRRNAGWSWSIPTRYKTGNGYVFCDRFINQDQAKKEMEESYDQKLEFSKLFKFDPGRLETAWNKNCYSVGLSQSFIEPLEATSIGSVIQQMLCFIHYLPSYDMKECNRLVNDIFDNAFDFVQAHYLTKKEDTPFWKHNKRNLNLTPSLKKRLECWKNRLPLSGEVGVKWGMFTSDNYIPVLYGLGWFDVDKIKEEYSYYYDDSDISHSHLRKYDSIPELIGHRESLERVWKLCK